MNEKTNIGQRPCADWRVGMDVWVQLQQLRQEKQEIYAALQQSELEANKWRCETEALRKALAKQTEESADYERQLKYEKIRANYNFEQCVLTEKEHEETKKKLAKVEKDRDVFRDELLNNMPALEKAAQSRAELEETKKKLADAEEACRIYRNRELNNAEVPHA